MNNELRKETVEREYLATFPAMKETYKAYVCATADGVGNAKERV